MKKIRIPENLTTLAFKAIKDYIWEGHLDEGARLTEDSLSQVVGDQQISDSRGIEPAGSRGPNPN